MIKIEEIQFELASKAPLIKKYLRKSHSERMPFEVIEIAHILKKLSLFARHCKNSTQDMATLALSTTSESAYLGDCIYSLGETPSHIYVVVQGKVLMKKDDLTYEYGPGSCFGENQIIFLKDQRVSSVECIDNCELMVIGKRQFCANLTHQQQIKEVANFMEKSLYFERIERFQLEILAIKMEYQKFRAGEDIIENGSGVLERVTWMIRGNAAVLKQIDLTIKGERVRKIFKIDTLVENSSFGQFECLNGLEPDVRIFCETSVSVYQLNLNEAVALSSRWLRVLRENSVEYPKDKDILETYKSELDIETKKLGMLDNLKRTSVGRKQYLGKKQQLIKSRNMDILYNPVEERNMKSSLLRNLEYKKV